MKKIMMLAAAGLVACTAAAQPVCNKAYRYTIGDTVTYAACDTNDVHCGQGGAAQVWDYTALTANTKTGIRIRDKNQVPDGARYPDATYAEVTSDGVVSFRKDTDTTSYLLGVYSGSQVWIQYQGGMLEAFRPMAYLQQRTDTFTNGGIANGISYSGSGTVTALCDGYGVLSTPGYINTAVLRLRVDAVEYDTIHLSPDVTTITHSSSFIWFDTVHAAPLLRIDSFYIETDLQDYGFKNVIYQEKQVPAGIKNATANNHPLTCVLDKNCLLIRVGLPDEQPYELLLTDQYGRVVTKRSSVRLQECIYLDTEPAAGIYTVRLYNKQNETIHSGRVVKR